MDELTLFKDIPNKSRFIHIHYGESVLVKDGKRATLDGEIVDVATHDVVKLVEPETEIAEASE